MRALRSVKEAHPKPRPEAVAQLYMRQGLAEYEYESYKTDAMVLLYNYQATKRLAYLNDAIYSTRVALAIRRLQSEVNHG